MAKRNTIWQNYNLDVEDWREHYMEQVWNEEVHEQGETPTDDMILQFAYESNDSFLDDERINLNIETEGQIIAIADLGLWHGRGHGYKKIGYNIKKILYTSCDFADWYCDRYNLKATMSHHDGTNYILYREFKPDLSHKQEDNFLEKLCTDKCTKQDISRYTRSIRPYVAKVYGW